MDEPALIFRSGQEADLPQIAEMTKDIWGGEDYLPDVWQEWVNDPKGRLTVGVLGEEIVAVGRVVELVPGGWWLEGLRVNPAHQGKGFATPLHNHLVALALQEPGVHTVGLATYYKNTKVAHLAQRSGMTLQGEYRFLKGAALPEPEAAVQPYSLVDIPSLFERLHASEWLHLTKGYLMDGWVTRPLDESWLTFLAETGSIWQCGAAIALIGIGAHSEQTWLYLVEGGEEAEQVALIRHARHLVFQGNPDGFLRCFIALHPTLAQPLLVAGLHDADDGEFHLLHFAMSVESSEIRGQ